ncbi:response regulator [Streptomyces sp. NPDC056844]|uniref:response regulator n=1 Tax=unclassified Streptomyces TaxID=2593676 RepID=UPI0036826548
MDSQGEPAEQVRIMIVDDDQLVRVSLRLIIEAEPDLTVIAEAPDGDTALATVDEHRPDVVLMDIRMPGRDGVSTTQHLLTRPSPPRVLMLTTFSSDDLVLDALRAGAFGFVVKDTPPPRILEAIRMVAQGHPALSPAATAHVIAAATGRVRDSSRQAACDRMASLTERQRDIARAIADGLDNQGIAARLNIKVATVKAHTTSLFTKLAVTNRVQIALVVRDAEG